MNYGAIVLKLIKTAERDMRNRYILRSDWSLPAMRIEDFAVRRKYRDRFAALESEPLLLPHLSLRADGGMLLMDIYRFDETELAVDGATGAPDNLPGVLQAAMFHDVWYLHLKLIAEFLGLPVSIVRKVGDQIFGNLIRLYGTDKLFAPVVAQVYYAGVRLFGGIAHRIGGLFAILLLVSLLSGCLAPIEFDELPIDQPDIEKVR